MAGGDALSARLLNDWQHGFPLVTTPFDTLGAACGVSGAVARERLAGLHAAGAISRIGAVWAPGAGGAAMLCAMAVPADRLEAVADIVSAHPGVNHNYEREHALNLWFVITGQDKAAVESAVSQLEADSGCPALRLRMKRAYRIDLGFDLNAPARGAGPQRVRAPAVAPEARSLAACAEAGLPFTERPYADWAAACDWDETAVIAQLEKWLAAGTLRRFGVVVRHHELGISANAMTVFDVPDDVVDAFGERLCRQRGVTLCYRRERAEGWPYNLYCMIHGRERAEVQALLADAVAEAGLGVWPHQVLFSLRRFKQQGARYFRPLVASSARPAGQTAGGEVMHG